MGLTNQQVNGLMLAFAKIFKSKFDVTWSRSLTLNNSSSYKIESKSEKDNFSYEFGYNAETLPFDYSNATNIAELGKMLDIITLKNVVDGKKGFMLEENVMMSIISVLISISMHSNEKQRADLQKTYQNLVKQTAGSSLMNGEMQMLMVASGIIKTITDMKMPMPMPMQSLPYALETFEHIPESNSTQYNDELREIMKCKNHPKRSYSSDKTYAQLLTDMLLQREIVVGITNVPELNNMLIACYFPTEKDEKVIPFHNRKVKTNEFGDLVPAPGDNPGIDPAHYYKTKVLKDFKNLLYKNDRDVTPQNIEERIYIDAFKDAPDTPQSGNRFFMNTTPHILNCVAGLAGENCDPNNINVGAHGNIVASAFLNTCIVDGVKIHHPAVDSTIDMLIDKTPEEKAKMLPNIIDENFDYCYTHPLATRKVLQMMQEVITNISDKSQNIDGFGSNKPDDDTDDNKNLPDDLGEENPEL